MPLTSMEEQIGSGAGTQPKLALEDIFGLPADTCSSIPPLPISTTEHQHYQLPSNEVIDWATLFKSHEQTVIANNYNTSASIAGVNYNGSIGGRNSEHRGVGKGGRGKKASVPRVAFHTRSSEDVLDDGYRWRKYGQKSVKNSVHPRSYYRCTQMTCNVKKQIQRLSKDPGIVMTTYEGIHNHPSEKLMETLGPLLKQLHLLSKLSTPGQL